MTGDTLTRANIAPVYYTRTLAAAYKRFLWLYDPDEAHQNDMEAWYKVRRDAVIAHAIAHRRHSIAGIDFQMIPPSDSKADKRAAAVMQDLIGGVRNFHQARYNLAEFVFRGSSWAYIDGKRQPFRVSDDRGLRDWWVPTQLKHVDRWRFRISRVEDQSILRQEIKTRWELFNVAKDDWFPLEHPEWFCRCDFEAVEHTLGYGRPLLSSIYFFWRAKEIALAQGLSGLERWAQGLITAKVDGVTPGSTDRTNDQLVDDWIEELTNQRSEHILVYGKQDEIEVITGGMEGHQIVMEMITYFDRALTQLILSSVLPTGGDSDKGSMARAEQEAMEKEIPLASDRKTISESLTDSLVKLTWNLNLNQIRALLREEGLGEARMPELSINQMKGEDPEKWVGVISQALQAGVPLKQQEVYEKLGMDQPLDDDAVFEAPGQPGGGLFGGGMEVGAGAVGEEGDAATEDMSPDLSAEDQESAELLNRVGGITGLLEVIGKVKDGVLDRESARNILIMFFRIDEADADKLIPQDIEEEQDDGGLGMPDTGFGFKLAL